MQRLLTFLRAFPLPLVFGVRGAFVKAKGLIAKFDRLLQTKASPESQHRSLIVKFHRSFNVRWRSSIKVDAAVARCVLSETCGSTVRTPCAQSAGDSSSRGVPNMSRTC